MNALAHSLAFWLALIAGLFIVYMLPTVIGLIRHIEHLGIVIGLNFIPPLWPAALLGAFMLPRCEPPQAWPPPTADPTWPNEQVSTPGPVGPQPSMRRRGSRP